MMRWVLLSCSIAGIARAQFPPEPKGITVLRSKFNENVTISFKEPGICETTPGVKSYSGYVHLPPGFLDNTTQNYPINTFFWFFEARKAPEEAPLAIWLNGGPGGSSMMGLIEENGPCFVNADSRTTRLNPWSWNNEVNMLYLDQPVQVGFSYDVATNGTLNFGMDGSTETVTPGDFSKGVPKGNTTLHPGTFASQNLTRSSNSTEEAAHALWHFAQTWFTEFPHYKPADNRISLWAESYGGHYGPGFMRFFQRQNEKITNGNSPEKNAHYLHFDTLGIVNGLIDALTQDEAYITYPYNNTYGLEIFNKSTHDELLHRWNKPGGCKAQVKACQDALKERNLVHIAHADKNFTKICSGVEDSCVWNAAILYQTQESARGWYDIGHPLNDPFPEPGSIGWFRDADVLGALGVPVNYTSTSLTVNMDFRSTFDIFVSYTDAVAYLLDSGVKVHMMYGDRDYACSWVGGEKVSLQFQHKRAADFAAAGYAPLTTPDGITGQTRQFGNLSFTRVYQAGHEVPSYQPIASYEIFMRATFNRDIATGLIPVTDELSTEGPKDVWHIKNTPPVMPKPRCYVLKPGTCTPEVWAKVVAGTVRIKDYWVVDEIEGAPDFGDDGDAQEVLDEL